RSRRSLVITSFTYTAPTETHTPSLHDALPIYHAPGSDGFRAELARLEVKDVAHTLDTVEVVGTRQARIGHDDAREHIERRQERQDRKSTRLNSSHVKISYAVFCLKKKKTKHIQ